MQNKSIFPIEEIEKRIQELWDKNKHPEFIEKVSPGLYKIETDKIKIYVGEGAYQEMKKIFNEYN